MSAMLNKRTVPLTTDEKRRLRERFELGVRLKDLQAQFNVPAKLIRDLCGRRRA